MGMEVYGLIEGKRLEREIEKIYGGENGDMRMSRSIDPSRSVIASISL